MATFLDAADFVVNFGNGFLQLIRGNIPGIIACASAMAATSNSFFKFSFDMTTRLIEQLLSGTEGMGPIHDFLQTLVDFLGSFAYDWYPKINAYFPLDFAMTALVLYLGAVATGVVVRSIKSFVPTVS